MIFRWYMTFYWFITQTRIHLLCMTISEMEKDKSKKSASCLSHTASEEQNWTGIYGFWLLSPSSFHHIAYLFAWPKSLVFLVISMSCLEKCLFRSSAHFFIVIFFFLMLSMKASTVLITKNCGKVFKRWEYQTTSPASWETCMQVKKQQLELDMEQQTGSK